MPRNRSKSTWTDSQLKAAVADVQSGKLGIRAAARKHGIPRSSLYDHLSGKSSKRYGGPSTVLTAEVEKEIATSCVVLQEFGFPVTKELVGVIVRDLLRDSDQASPFAGGVPGRDWWTRFLQRWPVLSQRKPQHLSVARAASATPAVRN